MPSQIPLSAIVTVGREEGMGALWSGFVPWLIWSATLFAVGIPTYKAVLARVIKTVVKAPTGACSRLQGADRGGVNFQQQQERQAQLAVA